MLVLVYSVYITYTVLTSVSSSEFGCVPGAVFPPEVCIACHRLPAGAHQVVAFTHISSLIRQKTDFNLV